MLELMFKNKLKVERIPQYLSPSSLSQAINEPNTFWLRRLQWFPFDKDPQGMAAAVGSAFDIQVKQKLWNDGIDSSKRTSYEDDLNNSIEVEENRKPAMAIGKEIMRNYKIHAYGQSNIKQVELWKHFTFHGVPFFGKLDATCIDKYTKEEIPFDWKCSGYNPSAKSLIGCKPGYYCMYQGHEIKGAHKNYKKDMPFEEVDYKWAVQCCIYGWSLGLSPNLDKPFPVRIDMQTKTKSKGERTTSYRGIITPALQKAVITQAQSVWKDIKNNTFQRRIASSYCNNLNWIASLRESWY